MPRPAEALPFDAEALKDWPANRATAHDRLGKATRADALQALLGRERSILFDVMASTERVGFAVADLTPDTRSDTVTFAHDATYHVEAGTLHVDAPDAG